MAWFMGPIGFSILLFNVSNAALTWAFALVVVGAVGTGLLARRTALSKDGVADSTGVS